MPPKRVTRNSSKSSLTKVTKSSKSTSSKAAKPSSSVAAEPSTTPDQPEAEKPVFFWREYGNKYAYMSQWYASPFTTDSDPEIVYQNAEQYMMYQKALLFNDPTTGSLILEQTSPKEIKAMGRLVQNFDEKTWLSNRERIVEEGSYFKFKNGKAAGEDMEGLIGEVGELWKRLEQTGERELVEASPRDRIWGIGFGEVNAEKMRKKWGLNLLGKALMEARRRLRDEEGAKRGDVEGEEVTEE